MNWHTAAAWLCVAVIFICIMLGLLGSLIESDRANRRDWRKFTVGNDAKPVPDSRCSISAFNRIRGQR
jgi:hypothetical protein